MNGHALADTDFRRGRHAPVSANVRDIGDIDSALIRPGRAFAVVRTRGLSREEATRFVQAIGVDRTIGVTKIVERAFAGGPRSVTLAELYRVMNT